MKIVWRNSFILLGGDVLDVYICIYSCDLALNRSLTKVLFKIFSLCSVTTANTDTRCVCAFQKRKLNPLLAEVNIKYCGFKYYFFTHFFFKSGVVTQSESLDIKVLNGLSWFRFKRYAFNKKDISRESVKIRYYEFWVYGSSCMKYLATKVQRFILTEL